MNCQLFDDEKEDNKMAASDFRVRLVKNEDGGFFRADGKLMLDCTSALERGLKWTKQSRRWQLEVKCSVNLS